MLVLHLKKKLGYSLVPPYRQVKRTAQSALLMHWELGCHRWQDFSFYFLGIQPLNLNRWFGKRLRTR